MNIFRCKHPFACLAVEKDATEKIIDEDFIEVIYYFRCVKCDKELTRKYSKLIGGVTEFLARACEK